MKKLLILILIGLLLTLTIFIAIQGVQIGKIEILGIKGIQAKNDELDSKIQEAGKLVEKDYQQVMSSINNNTKKLEQEKKNYEDMIVISDEGEIQAASQIEKYEIEALWVKVGNHATSQGTNIKMDIEKGANSAQGVYNLRFTATGGYIQIVDFISAIENDSTLGFKIEEFKMIPASTNGDLQATFLCRDIAIKEISAIPIDNNANQGNTTTTSGNNNMTNTNNTANVNSTTNTSNTNVAR